MLKRVLCLMLTLAMVSCGITAFASEALISDVVIAETAEVGKNLEVTYDLAEGVKESDVSVKWYIAAPGDDVFYDTGVTGKNFLVEYAHAGMGIKAKVSADDTEVWSNTVTEGLTSLVSADDKFDSDLVISASDGYTINSGTVQRNATDNVLELVKGAAKSKVTRNFPAVTGKFAFSFKVKNSATLATSVVVGGSGGVASILTYNGQKITASVLNDTGNAAATFTAGSNYTVGDWHLLSGAFDTDSDTFSLYVDGKKVFDKKGFRTVANGAPVDIKNISYVYYEIPANAAGNSCIDNVNVRKIHPLPVCEAPVAENVTIVGSNKIGSTVSVDYDYSGEYMECGSKYSWYASTEENGNYTKLTYTSKTLTIDDALAGLYIKAGVAPANVWGAVGTEVISVPKISNNVTATQLSDNFATLPTGKFSVNASGSNTVSVENESLKLLNVNGAPIATYTVNKPLTGKTYIDFLIKNTEGQAWCRVKGSVGDGVKMAIDAKNNFSVNGMNVATLSGTDWCRVKLVVNLVGNTTSPALDVYVNGQKKAEGLALTAALANVTSVAMAKTTAGAMYIDDLKVFNVDLTGGVLSNGISWKYNSTTKTLTFSGVGAMPDYSTVVDKADPSYFENKDWNSFVSVVENVVIGEGITAVGSNCFRSTNNLKTVVLPSTCESINAYAFIRSGVEKITIPEGVKSIGDGAFAMATSLKEVALPISLKNVHSYAFGGDLYLETIYAYAGSAAEKFALDKGINLILTQAVGVTEFDAETNIATINSVEADEVAVIFASYLNGSLKSICAKQNVFLNKGETKVPADDFATESCDEVKIFVWDSLVSMTPVAKVFEKKPTVWMIGDSIMADWPDSRYPQEGWGEAFKQYTAEGITVNNKAISGYTAENFYENVWSTNNRDNTKTPLRDEVSEGDFVIVSFVHNDYCTVANSELETYQSTEYINVYKSYIEKFVEDCEEIGAKIVLMVPPNKGVTYNLHAMKVDGVDVGDYSAVIPAVAEAKNIPCVDIHKWTIEQTEKDVSFLDTVYLTANYINGLVENGKLTQAQVETHSNSGIRNNGYDTTHISVDGCQRIAQFVVDSIKSQNIELTKVLK